MSPGPQEKGQGPAIVSETRALTVGLSSLEGIGHLGEKFLCSVPSVLGVCFFIGLFVS